MRRSAYGYIEVKPKPKKPRLQRQRRDEFEDMRDWREAYGNKFFSPALQRIINERTYNKT